METKTFVRDGERLDDLCDGYKILQRPSKYCFTSDSVLLANFVSLSGRNSAVDLCSGSGIVGILTAIKNNFDSMTLVEIQSDMCEMSRRSVELNSLQKIEVVNCDVKDCASLLGKERFDVVECNPPYYRLNEGKMSEVEEIAMCRHEVTLTLSEVIRASSELLKFGGKAYFVYRADRLSELIVEMSKNKLEPKDIVVVKPNDRKEADTVLVCAKKGGEKGVRVRSFTRDEIEKDYSILKRK